MEPLVGEEEVGGGCFRASGTAGAASLRTPGRAQPSRNPGSGGCGDPSCPGVCVCGSGKPPPDWDREEGVKLGGGGGLGA